MMTLEQAKSLILSEGDPSDNLEALYIAVRMGEEPTTERMQLLLEALRVVQRDCSGLPAIERRLAGALWILGESVLSNLLSWKCNGMQWREGFEDEVLTMSTLIEDIFIDADLPSCG